MNTQQQHFCFRMLWCLTYPICSTYTNVACLRKSGTTVPWIHLVIWCCIHQSFFFSLF